jgi:hypothetical protein
VRETEGAAKSQELNTNNCTFLPASLTGKEISYARFPDCSWNERFAR